MMRNAWIYFYLIPTEFSAPFVFKENQLENNFNSFFKQNIIGSEKTRYTRVEGYNPKALKNLNEICEL
jgi:hypothetical protein